MGIFEKIFGNKIDEPIFVKEYDQDNNIQLNQLNDLLEKVGDDQKKIVEAEIKKIQYGLIGERNVAYELKNSFLPIVCLHDIRLEYKDYSAQFDFIVITHQCIIVLETKSLINDIIIESTGDFIRVFKDYKGNVYKKEGMNSPVSQNEKHINILRRFLDESKFKKNIPIASVIVMANPKSIITMKYTKKEIKNLIIKHDQIKTKIKEICNHCSNSVLNDRTMLEIADYINDNDKHIEYDFVKMLGLKIEEKSETIIEPNGKEEFEETKSEISIDDSLYESLRKLRLKLAKQRNVEAYIIFNNEQLSNLVLSRPTNKEEFIAIPGFGERKFDDFGQDIINVIISIINKNEENQIQENELYIALKQFRLHQSKIENIKPYFIFNNQQLEELCTKKPITKDELMGLDGFGDKKYEKYGVQIIDIIKRH